MNNNTELNPYPDEMPRHTPDEIILPDGRIVGTEGQLSWPSIAEQIEYWERKETEKDNAYR